MTRKATLSRRTVLRGAGVSLGLPWLEAMSSGKAFAASSEPAFPVRMAVLYMPNGVNTTKWTPEGSGKKFTLSPTLEPLTPFKDSITVVSNTWNEAAKDGDGHYVKESSILTCRTITKTLGADLHNGVSIDQLAAQRVGNRTPLPSLLQRGKAIRANRMRFCSTGCSMKRSSCAHKSGPQIGCVSMSICP
jgi:hypothetical protein